MNPRPARLREGAARLSPRPGMSERERFARFLVAGGMGAITNLGSRAVLNLFWTFEISVAVAYFLGMVVAFSLTRLFVFDRADTTVRQQFVRFAAVNAVSFAMVWTTSVLLARLVFPAAGFTWHARAVAHLLAVLVPIAFSYVGHKRFSFGQGLRG